MLRKNAIALLVVFLLRAVSPVFAGVQQVSVRVDGIACPFCAYNIEKRVKTLDGVEKGARIVTSIEHGKATFPWKTDVAFDPDAVRKAIREAGFTPRQISVTATGTIEAGPTHDPEATLRLIDEKAKLVLSVRPAKRADRLESWETLKAFAGPGLSVRVEGEVGPDSGDASFEVLLHRWAPLEFGAEIIAEVDDLASQRCSTRIMRALAELEGVIHVEADHASERVNIWTRHGSPDLGVLRERIESLGFNVAHMHDVAQEDGDALHD